MNGKSEAGKTRSGSLLNSQSRGSSKIDDLAAHGGILEVSDFDRAVRLGFRGRAVTTLIHRGFRLLGRFLLHVLSNAVSLASRIA